MDPLEWDRPEGPPRYDRAGLYNIVAVGSSEDGMKSASAFRVIPLDPELRPIEGVVGHDESESTGERGAIAAVAMGIETVPPDSQVMIICRQASIAGALNEWIDNWVSKGWRRSDGHIVANHDIYRRIFRIKIEKRMIIRARYVRADADEQRETFDHLAQLARSESRRKFDPV